MNVDYDGVGRITRRGLISWVVALGCFGYCTAMASAGTGFAPRESFVAPGGFGPLGVAVDNTSNVFKGDVPGAVITFETGSVPPEISGEAFSAIGVHNATVTGQVNPESLAGNYYIEYATGVLPSTSEYTKTPGVAYPLGMSPFTATVQLNGLEPNVRYHFRLVAVNSKQEIGTGPENSFTTLPIATATLPDGRVYEMVTPTGNNDADVHTPRAFGGISLSDGTHTELPFEVAMNGTAVTYVADPTFGGFGSGGNGLGNQYLARRMPTGGWKQTNLQPLARELTFYRAFSADLSIGILASGSEADPRLPPLSPQAPGEGYGELYACADNAGACTSPESEGEFGNAYQSLYRKPLNRIPAEFRATEGGHRVYIAREVGTRGAVFAGGSSDFGHLLFEVNDALPGVEGPHGSELEEHVKHDIAAGENNDYLYDLEGSHLGVVDILPQADGGGLAGNATFGAPPFTDIPQLDQPNFSHVISGDGRKIFWTDLNTGLVYARIDGDRTVQVSLGAARYWTSAADGRYVFYAEGEDLYRFDLEAKTLSEERKVLAGVGAGVLGVIGTSDDGGSVYFVAEGVLGSRESGEGVSPVPGQPNLYLSRNDGTPVFVATLSSKDGHAIAPFIHSVFGANGEYGDWLPGSSQRTAEVAADGSSVVFMSNQKLASVGFPGGYPNNGLEEVYVYQAGADRLICASCSSSGESPPGSEAEAAAFLPISWVNTYLPQWVSQNGSRVFFDSAVPLVAPDTNRAQDVYEWEREGFGSCTLGSGGSGGCVYLLSGGTSPHASWLLGASASGDDAFVVTRTQLTQEDQNEAFDVYDARVGGLEPPLPPVCMGTGCQGIPAPAPVFATPPSVTFNGVGNFSPRRPEGTDENLPGKKLTRSQKLKRALKTCRAQHNSHGRAMCRMKARKRYGEISSSVNTKHRRGM